MNQSKPQLFCKIDERVMNESLVRKCLMDDPTAGQGILYFFGTIFSDLRGVQMKLSKFAHVRKVAHTVIRYIEVMQPELRESG